MTGKTMLYKNQFTKIFYKQGATNEALFFAGSFTRNPFTILPEYDRLKPGDHSFFL